MKNPDNGSLTLYQRYRNLSLGLKILIYLAVGMLVGAVFGEKALIVQPLGDLFIRLLMMAAIPLVFFNLLAGITTLEDVRSLGRIGARISLYYLFTTILALTLGLSIMHLLKPGVGMQLTGTIEANIGEVP
ncbi:cation:dicarboxylase symporter family transporter, partial [bacterium]|nr:cation:dicarboxylase symporter family transporter [bacterium]